ncbi:MAG: tRNA (adenosine(37)-N6)-dimethylallyltransferase MiaA [Gemmatimonadetes bacterium]|nr:tRNA (adenosine(37)-N6)-dimethylallyltransferase MiaA [Gemmatimonadota bacterium]
MTVWRCIVGPTAAGKSAIAMALARTHGVAILSADSRQGYRGFDIGTAKPSLADRAEVPHYGVDVLDPGDRWSAWAWAEAARRWAADAATHGRAALVVGGTGLYVRALVEPLDSVPDLPETSRAQLDAWLTQQDQATLERWCRRLDPARAALGRTQRLRAIETALLAGRRLGDLFLTRGPAQPADRARYLVVDPGPVLASRIAQRVQAMLDAGWREEVDRLRAVVPADAPAWKASGYTVLRASREGERSEADAVARVIIETRQYAKRQRTWFRHQLPADAVTLLDPTAPDALARAHAWWEEGTP